MTDQVEARPLRLLVVDDHEVVRQGLVSLLERREHFQVVAEAGTAAEAVEMARKFEPDLVVMDVRLPDGPTATLLTFELPAGSRVLPWPEVPLHDVVCALGVHQDQGLVLYWHSRLEEHFADEPPRATVLSPLVTALSYDYYNTRFNSWQNFQNWCMPWCLNNPGIFPCWMRPISSTVW